MRRQAPPRTGVTASALASSLQRVTRDHHALVAACGKLTGTEAALLNAEMRKLLEHLWRARDADG